MHFGAPRSAPPRSNPRLPLPFAPLSRRHHTCCSWGRRGGRTRTANRFPPVVRGAWGLGWDYLRHYAFSTTIGCGLSCAAAASRLIAAAAEASRLRSATDAAQWMRLHYGDIRDAAAQLLNGLLLAFSEEVTDLFTRGASDSHIALSICDICYGLGAIERGVHGY